MLKKYKYLATTISALLAIQLLFNNFSPAQAADLTPKWQTIYTQPILANLGDAAFNLSLPSDFVPSSEHFKWVSSDPKITTLDGMQTNTLFDTYTDVKLPHEADVPDPATDGFVKIKIVGSGRNVTIHIYSMLSIQISTTVTVSDLETQKGKSVSTPISARFLESTNPDALVVKLPLPDNIKLDINNPKTMGSDTTKISVAIPQGSNSHLQTFNTNVPNYGRTFFIQRVTPTGQPMGGIENITPTASEQNWFQWNITQESYIGSGLTFRVYFTQAIPQFTGFGGNSLSSVICEYPANCGNSPYDHSSTVLRVAMYKDFNVVLDFAKQPKKASFSSTGITATIQNQIKSETNSFRWTPYTGTLLSANSASPTKNITFGNSDADGIYYFFKADLANFPANATCLDTEADLQYLSGKNWKSVWADADYSAIAANSFYTPLGKNPNSICLDSEDSFYTNSYIPESNRTTDVGLPLPNLKDGEHQFRIVLKNQFRNTDAKVGTPFDAIAPVFKIKYVSPPPPPPKLKVTVTYPRIVVLGKSYIASVITSPTTTGSCDYFLFNGMRTLIGTKPLKSGISSFSFPAMSSNANSGQLSSLTVVCTAGKITGTGAAYFLATSS